MGNPLGYSLTGGGACFLCSKRRLMPADTEFVGIEMSHDIEVIETNSAIRHKIDAAMIKGIELIKSKNT